MPLNGQKRPNVRNRCWSVARVVKSEKDTATALSNYTETEIMYGGDGQGVAAGWRPACHWSGSNSAKRLAGWLLIRRKVSRR